MFNPFLFLWNLVKLCENLRPNSWVLPGNGRIKDEDFKAENAKQVSMSSICFIIYGTRTLCSFLRPVDAIHVCDSSDAHHPLPSRPLVGAAQLWFAMKKTKGSHHYAVTSEPRSHINAPNSLLVRRCKLHSKEENSMYRHAGKNES